MARIHISETEAARDFAGLLARVRAGEEVVIESGFAPVVVMHCQVPTLRTFEEALALMPEDRDAIIDEDFAADVQAAIDAHR